MPKLARFQQKKKYLPEINEKTISIVKQIKNELAYSCCRKIYHFLRDDEAGCVRFETAKVGYFGKWRPK